VCVQVLLKAYNANVKDCNKIMDAAHTSSVGELVELFKTMVHIQVISICIYIFILIHMYTYTYTYMI